MIDMPEMQVLTEDEARRRQNEWIDSGEWWVIPWLSPKAAYVSQAIEQKAYKTEESAKHFHIVMAGPGGLTTVTFAKKEFLDSLTFAGILRDFSPHEMTLDARWRLLDAANVVEVPDHSDPVKSTMEFGRWKGWLDEAAKDEEGG